MIRSVRRAEDLAQLFLNCHGSIADTLGMALGNSIPSGLVSASPARKAVSGAATVIVVSLVVAALIFSNSMAARRATDEARVLHQAEATLGATNLVVKALSQAVLLAEDEVLGVADVETSARASDEASDTLSDLSERTEGLLADLGGDEELADVAEGAISSGMRVIALLSEGMVEGAGSYLSGPAKEAFEDLRDVAASRRDQAAEGVESTSDLISRIGNLPAFLIAFLIPALAIMSYRRIARGQLRLAEVQLDARLESEHELVLAKDEFVANISHELRTPLTSIYGFSELLLEQGFVDPDLSFELVGMINVQSAELHRMVEDLLASARHEAGTIALKVGPVDLAATVEGELSKLDQTEAHLETHFRANTVWGDGARVRHILRNLLSNALRYGGRNVRITSEARSDHAAIVVADDGPGVEASKVGRLFTRYVHDGQDPLTVGSVGLGLSIVRILAEAMGGDAAYRREDGWTHFIVRLPLTEQAATSSRLPPARAGSLPPHVAAADPPESEATVRLAVARDAAEVG